jgi:hypothetical protein
MKKNTKGTSVLSSLLWVILFTSSCRKSRTLSNLASLRVKTPVRVQSSEFRQQLFIQRIFNPKLPTSKAREKVFILVNEC